MGRLTDDMTRLVEEIHTGRADRARTIREVKHGTAEMKRAVGETQARFRSARADMVRRQRRMLQGFASGLRGTVGGLRNEFAADLAGAHSAWVGAAAPATPGRPRRGGRWFSSESA